MKEKTLNYLKNTAVALVIIMSFLACISKTLTGFDIDESYAVVLPLRLIQGDIPFKDMWEVHQTSVFLPFIFVKLYSFFVPSFEGLVIFLRICALIIHLIISIYLYFMIKKLFPETDKLIPFLFSAGYFNFFPKWMMNIDFSMEQLWFYTLLSVSLLLFFNEEDRKRKAIHMLLSGFFLAFDVLAYPGMLILFPVIIVMLFKDNKRYIIHLILGCFIPALVFMTFILLNMDVSSFIHSLTMVFMDGTHKFNFSQKLFLYGSQWARVLLEALILLAPAIPVSEVIIFILNRKINKDSAGNSVKDEKERQNGDGFKLFAKNRLFMYMITFEILWSAFIICAKLFVPWGPFRLQTRYIIGFALVFPLVRILLNQNLIRMFYLQLFAFVGILISSNVGPSSSSSYLVIGNLMFASLLIEVTGKQVYSSQKHDIYRVLSITGAFLFTFSLIMCKGFYMRNTEYVPGDITAPLSKMEVGPLKGIYVHTEDKERFTDNYDTIQANTTSDDQMLFMGTETLSCIYGNGSFVIPTTISTPAFNEQWIAYFKENPDKIPTVVFIAKNTIDDRDLFFSEDPFGFFLEEYFDISEMKETEYLCILHR